MLTNKIFCQCRRSEPRCNRKRESKEEREARRKETQRKKKKQERKASRTKGAATSTNQKTRAKPTKENDVEDLSFEFQ